MLYKEKFVQQFQVGKYANFILVSVSEMLVKELIDTMMYDIEDELARSRF